MLIRRVSVCASAVLLILVAGCSGGARRYSVPSISASGSASKAMAEFDTNQDGVIKGDELNKCPSLKAALTDIDKDGDGGISAEEISDRIKQWQETKQARTGVTVSVYRNGRPLADADVKFVPENFLGGALVTGTGKTGKGGQATISVPRSTPGELPGIDPGFYRVEITKEGDKIPAKYNTETTLGAEVSIVATWAQPRGPGLKFKLKY